MKIELCVNLMRGEIGQQILKRGSNQYKTFLKMAKKTNTCPQAQLAEPNKATTKSF